MAHTRPAFVTKSTPIILHPPKGLLVFFFPFLYFVVFRQAPYFLFYQFHYYLIRNILQFIIFFRFHFSLDFILSSKYLYFYIVFDFLLKYDDNPL